VWLLIESQPLAHLRRETPVADCQVISHHRYHMLTYVGCVGRWGVVGPRGGFVRIGADGYDDSARQVVEHQIDDATILHALAGDDLTCQPEHDTRDPRRSLTHPDHRPPRCRPEDR
jgi:hypothetical protein